LQAIAAGAFTDEIRQYFFRELDINDSDVTDLGGFESFVFAFDDKILRITHFTHRMPEQIAAELEFIKYLAENGAAVCQPNRLPNGQLLLTYALFSACVFDCARGRLATGADMSPSFIRRWGGCIGTFHRLARDFEPDQRRIDWRADENHDFSARIPVEQAQIIEIGNDLLKGLETLPVNRNLYGLIHGDAHAGNFFTDDGRLTFFDFDDAIFMWFSYDIATVLFGAVLGRHVTLTRRAQEAEAKRFLPPFLEGYAAEFPVGKFVMEEMHRFLKLRELSLYAVIHDHMDVNNLTDWYPVKFMKDRQQRIEKHEPFLDMDFTRLWT
jgi:amicoumacin kinase